MPVVTILASVVISLATVFGVYNYVPADLLQLPQLSQPRELGATITTILGSDTLSGSRSVINTNFANLNSDKIEATQTTLASLTTVGTIGTGVWQGTKIGVAYGGTNIASYSTGDILYASGATTLSKLSVGSNGQFLQLSGGLPVWATASVDTTGNYTWTGIHNFVGSATYIKTLTASSTITFDNGGAPLSYVFPTTRGSNGQVLTENGSGALSFATTTPVRYVLISNDALTPTAGSYATSSKTVFIPAGTLTASSTIAFRATSSACISSSSGGANVYLRSSTGATLLSAGIVDDSSSYTGSNGVVQAMIGSNNSATFSSQIWNGNTANDNNSAGNVATFGAITGTASLDFSSGITLVVVMQNTDCNTSAPSLNSHSIIVER